MRSHLKAEGMAAQLKDNHHCCSISTMLKIGSIKLYNVRMTQLPKEKAVK